MTSSLFQLADAQPADAVQRRRLLFGTLLIALITLLIYARTWPDPLLGWDDDENVLRNPLVVAPGLTGVRELLTRPFATDYYPLTYASLALDHWVWRGHLFGYHITQTLWHCLNVILVARLTWRWTGAVAAAWLAAAWFAWHPMQVETVAWIAERKNVLGTFFFLLAWLAYLREDERGRRWALAAFIAAVLCHALVIVLPALLLAYELGVARRSLGEAWRRTWLFFVPALLAAGLRALGHAASGQLETVFATPWQGVLTMTKVVGEYLATLFWPVHLSNHYTELGADRLTDPGVLATLAGVLIVVALAWRAPRWRRPLLFTSAWFLIALAPVLGLVPHPTLRADRYLYVAAIAGFVFVAGWLASDSVWRLRAGVVAAGLLLALTWQRIPAWQNAKTLWTDCLAKNPRDAVAHFSLAGCAIKEANWPVAEQQLHDTLRLRPNLAVAYERLGSVLLLEGRGDQARAALVRALQLDPHLAQARYNLGLIKPAVPTTGP